MRLNECSFPVIRARYHIGTSTVQLILSRFETSGLSLNELRQMDPHLVEELIYPQENIRRKDIPLPDFQYYYDRINGKGSKVNLSYCWIEYKRDNPDGYEQSPAQSISDSYMFIVLYPPALYKPKPSPLKRRDSRNFLLDMIIEIKLLTYSSMPSLLLQTFP